MKKRYSKKDKINITLKTIKAIENELKKRKNYKGLISIATHLTNYYFTNYYNNLPKNYNLQDDLKTIQIAKLVNLDILGWLLKNYHRYKNSFNLKLSIKNAERITRR
ncbi:hypothetical protein DRN73_07175 [Candidatus Pacearchaeota archaeon]|nr:MAG: hypothetical protein DRN73_07175 [Candidatus Pacearchaeota archaeon]